MNGFDRAQTQKDNAEPPEPQCVAGFYIGDPVEIANPFMIFFSDLDGADTKGTVCGFGNGTIRVQHGMRVHEFYPDDLKRV